MCRLFWTRIDRISLLSGLALQTPGLVGHHVTVKCPGKVTEICWSLAAGKEDAEVWKGSRSAPVRRPDGEGPGLGPSLLPRQPARSVALRGRCAAPGGEWARSRAFLGDAGVPSSDADPARYLHG